MSLGNSVNYPPAWREPTWAKLEGELREAIVSSPVWLLIGAEWREGFWIQSPAYDAGERVRPGGWFCEPYGPALANVDRWLPRALVLGTPPV